MNGVLKWAGGIILGLLGLAAVVAIITVIVANNRANEVYEVQGVAVALPDDEESIAEGQRQAAIRACTECHGPDLTGGLFIDDPALGTIYATNLTPGGVVADYTIEDWDRAVRHGLDQSGRPLLVMPSLDYARISDEDLGRMVAYMESLPPSDAAWPESRLGPLGYVLIASGQLPFAAQEIDHSLVQPASVPVAVSAAYGEYLAQTCVGCHGSGFAGGPVPGSGPGDVPAANLTPEGNLGNWSEAEFVAAMRTGTTPEGKMLDPALMPWPVTELMTDEELAALWLHFSSLPAVATGE